MEKANELPARYRSPLALADLPAGAPVAVALSGGADSVALLHMLHLDGVRPLLAVHVHHGIRGEEADRDAAFCEALCRRLDVPLTVLRVDVPALAARQGLGLETAAREARYAAFSAFLKEREIPLLLTAHHADDQLETLLQHLLRGSGLRGLCGIPACRALDGALVARPLLQISKAEILSYCSLNGLDFVTDTTNGEPCCPRNRLRAEVLPVLAELWPCGSERAARCADALAQDEAYLAQVAAEFLAREGVRPAVPAMAALPRPILVRVLQQLLPQPPEAVHIDAVEALLKTARPDAALSLPGARVSLENGRFCVDTEQACEIPFYKIPLTLGNNPLPCGVAQLYPRGALPPLSDTAYPHVAQIAFSAAAVRGGLYVRPRLAGERIYSGGCHKLVRKLPAMTALPKSVRVHAPLLCDDEGVLAVPFGPVRDGAARGADLVLRLLFE